MTDQEIVQALRCISTVCNATDRNCPDCGYFRKWFGCDADRLSKDAADLIERLTAENAKAEAERDALLEKKRWILVSKKEPEYDMPQLAMTSDGEVLIANYAYGEWFDTWGQDVDVTHWMPLPEAQEEGEKA